MKTLYRILSVSMGFATAACGYTAPATDEEQPTDAVGLAVPAAADTVGILVATLAYHAKVHPESTTVVLCPRQLPGTDSIEGLVRATGVASVRVTTGCDAGRGPVEHIPAGMALALPELRIAGDSAWVSYRATRPPYAWQETVRAEWVADQRRWYGRSLSADQMSVK